MNTKGILALTLAALIGLSGCASMSEEECAFSDWTAVGYEDGAQGATSEQFGEYRRDCADHGVTPDFQAWQAGRSQGLMEYCQPSRGFNLGERGGRYNGVCNGGPEQDFLDAYRIGSQLYTLRANLNAASSRINSNTRTIELIDAETAEKEALLVARGTSTEDRVLLLADVKELSERKGELEEQLYQLIEERTLAQLELNQYQASISGYGF